MVYGLLCLSHNTYQRSPFPRSTAEIAEWIAPMSFSRSLIFSSLSRLLLLLCASNASAELQLSPLFSDHAILQRDRPISIWGWASPEQKIRVTLGQQSAEATADFQGRWEVKLQPQAASSEGIDLQVEIIGSAEKIERRDILFGDVWLCSGQSNMEWPLVLCDAPDDIASAKFPLIRHFGVEMNFASHSANSVRGMWQIGSPDTAGGFTAVGFYFARKLHNELKIPIGLVRSSVGGTNIELWMSQETLLNTPQLEPYAAQMRASLDQYREDLKKALPAIEIWTKASREAMQSDQPIPLPPPCPEFPFAERVARPRCVTLHNGMIAPLIPNAFRGVIWYQGENNAGDAASAKQYIEKKRALIEDWRRWFGSADFPFYFVQLASWQQPNNDPAGGDGWAIFRDAQRQALSIDQTGMAVTTDLGDANDIHPKNKADVGERLALWALAKNYGQEIEYSGPLFKQVTIEGNRIRIHFDHVGKGLMVGEKIGRQPVKQTATNKLKRFAIAGQNRRWFWADATIDGDTVVCEHPDVPEPIAVRYAFSMNPEGANLYNREGLPASPFRSDDF